MALSRSQLATSAGMFCAALLTIGAFLSPVLPRFEGSGDRRLILWFSCAVVIAFWLLLSIGQLARHRFFSQVDIDGSGVSANSPRAALLQALLQNTLEQAVLALIAYGAWIWLGPADRMGLVIVLAVYFSVGRLLFFIGYTHGAPARALGFGLTFYPSVALILLVLPLAIGKLLGG